MTAKRLRDALRRPVLRALRASPWYRHRAHLPTNALVDPAACAATSAAHGGGLTPVHAEEHVTLAPPAPDEPVPPQLALAGALVPAFTVPPTYVALLHDVRIVGRGVAVLAAGGEVVTGLTVHLSGPLDEHGVYRRFSLPRPRHLPGRSALLSTPGGNTYYHWLLEVLPRLELLRQGGYEPRELPRLLVNSARHRFQRETLSRLGIDLERVVSTDALRHVRCDELVAPSFTGTSGFPPRWVCRWVADALPPADDPDASAPRRLYVSRRRAAKRRLRNEAALERVLEGVGFSTVLAETRSVAEQARLFRAAELIIGVHGSGLTNLVFARAGAAVVELFHPAKVLHHFWVLARQMGVRYGAVVGTEVRGGREDFTVVPEAVLAAVDRLAVGAPASA